MSETVPPGETKSDVLAGSLPPVPFSERYIIQEEIGRGGMGVVYRALHRHLNKPMAIKVLRSDIDRDRFLREAQLLAKINSPFVVGVHDYECQADGSPMLVMELLDGEGFEQTISRGPVPEPQAVTWMRQTATALATAADLGIVHRDVKPSNIRINKQGQARLMDFGLARSDSLALALTQSALYLGTPYYMSPEQAEDPRSVDSRADMYSFGATFYHALTGRPPFEGKTPFAVLFKHKTEPLAAVQSLNPQVSNVVAEVIERCLAKSPASRFASFAEIIRCLSAAEERSRPWRTGDENAVSPHFEQFKTRRANYLRREMTSGPEDVYTFKNGRRLKIELGDIARQQVDVIVSPDNSHLTMDFGCAKAIARAAGADIYQLVQQFVPVLPGRVVVTPGGRMQCRFIFHAVTNGFVKQSFRATRDIIAELVTAIFYHADTLSVQSIAVPLLGAGGARLAQEEALEAMFLALARHLDRGVTSVEEVRLVLYRDTLVALHNILQQESDKQRDDRDG